MNEIYTFGNTLVIHVDIPRFAWRALGAVKRAFRKADKSAEYHYFNPTPLLRGLLKKKTEVVDGGKEIRVPLEF